MVEMSIKSYMKSVTFQRNDIFGKLSHSSFSSVFVRPGIMAVKYKVALIKLLFASFPNPASGKEYLAW